MPTLGELSIGAKAMIESFTSSSAVAQRLMEMGLIEGEAIELIGVAPLGDPLEVQIRGYLLSLRRAEADLVIVRPVEP